MIDTVDMIVPGGGAIRCGAHTRSGGLRSCVVRGGGVTRVNAKLP